MRINKPRTTSQSPNSALRVPRAAILLFVAVFAAGALFRPAVGAAAEPGAARTAPVPPTEIARVTIDILPGEDRNIVDPSSPETVAVAILGTPSLDPDSIDLQSLHLAGAAAVKNAGGATHAVEDVNGDGRPDLIVWFSTRALQITDADVFAVLVGTTRGGIPIEGRDAIRTLAAELRADAEPRAGAAEAPGEPASTGSEEKLPPLHAAIVVLEAGSSHLPDAAADTSAGLRVALLAGPDLDPADVVLETVRINGRPITRMRSGEVASRQDVNGDGLVDLVVAVSAKSLADAPAPEVATVAEPASLLLNAVTRTGRFVTGDARVAPTWLAEDGRAEPAPAELAPVKAPPSELAPVKAAPSEPAQAGPTATVPSSPADTDPGMAALSAPGNTTTGRFTGGIQIVDLAPAVQYPATIHMSGLSGVVSKVRVTLNGIVHSCFIDLDVMLVGPTGQSIVLMSDVGGCGPANATDLTFDDFATGRLEIPSPPPPTPSTWIPYNQGYADPVGDPFVAPAPVPSLAAALSAFIGTNPNGDWKLYVIDDSNGDTGSIRDGWTLDIETTTQVCNTSAFTIPAGAPGTTSGPASLYPSSINVSGLPPQITKLSVTLDGLTHQSPEDLDVMLVAPGGQRVMLMSDSGGSFGVTNYQLTFDDDATGFLPDATVIPSPGSYRPTDRLLTGPLPPPAPGGNYYQALLPLRGTNPNGTWQLWVADRTAGGVGSVARGWCLNVTTIAPAENCMPIPLTVPAGAPATTVGPADIYPNGIYVTGTTGLIQDLRVKLMGLTHTYPDDLDIVLESPSGKTMVLLSDVGSSFDVSNLDVTIDTASVTPAPDSSQLGPGPYRPTDAEPGDSLPAPAPAAPYVTSLYGEPPNGGWQFYAADDAALDWGTIGGWCMSFTLFEPNSYCTTGSLLIPGGGTSGVAFPYPWGSYVGQQGTVIGKVQVRLNTLNHTYPDDLDMVLIGPHGQSVVLMSDAGGSTDASNVWLTFDDDALDILPDTNPLSTLSYRPANYDGGDADVFPPNAPPGPYGSQLSVFRGTDPQGWWEIFVNDDATGDIGTAAQWCLDIFPLYPVGEATNLRWSNKTTLMWDAAPNATGYRVLRGSSPTFLPNLLSNAVDSCVAVSPSGVTGSGLAQLPGVGSMFWYLVTGTNSGPPGPAGRARIGGSETARIVDAPGTCNAP